MASPSLETVSQTAITRWGKAAAREAAHEDALDGHVPRVVLEPRDVATLTEMLQWANAERLTMVIRGGGSTLGWGAIPTRVDVTLSTAHLTTPIDHCAGDLTATVPAGATLASVNATLGDERQWLPLDPPEARRATIGGIIATNDSGPRRHRYGTPRDLIIGVEMALVDGRTAKAGGKVVKNVAGYDLARLLCGSFGSLAVITAATFKLSPAPPASRTVVATAGFGRPMTDLALAIAEAPLTPSTVELQSPSPSLLIRFETTETAADRQAEAARRLCQSRGIEAEIVSGKAEASIWQNHEDRLKQGSTLLKLAVLPTQVGDVLEHLERLTEKHGIETIIVGRAALGVLLIAVIGSTRTWTMAEPETPPAPETVAAVVNGLRQNAWARGGSVVVRSAAPEVKALVEVWGDVGDGLQAMRAVKAQFDPNRILNAGRGPGGI